MGSTLVEGDEQQYQPHRKYIFNLMHTQVMETNLTVIFMDCEAQYGSYDKRYA